MRLAALVDVELELGMRSREVREQRVERRRLLAGEERQHAARLARAASRGRRARLRRRSRRPPPARLPRARATSLLDRDAVQLDVAARDRDRAGGDPASRLLHRRRRSRRRRSAGSKATSAASPAWIDRVGTTRTIFAACRRACSALMITLPLFGSTTTSAACARLDRGEEIGRRGVHRAPPSTTRAPKLSSERAVAAPAVTTTTAHASAPASGTACSSRSSRCCGLRVHVRDLDAADDAARGAERERAARIVGVDVHLQRVRSPTTSSESPSCSSSVSSASASRSSPSTTKTVQ